MAPQVLWAAGMKLKSITDIVGWALALSLLAARAFAEHPTAAPTASQGTAASAATVTAPRTWGGASAPAAAADKASTIAEREYFTEAPHHIEATIEAGSMRVAQERFIDAQRQNGAATNRKGKPVPVAEPLQAKDAGTPAMTPPPSTFLTISAKPSNVPRPSAKSAVLITTALGKDGRYHVVTKHVDVDMAKLVTVMGPTGKLFQRDPATGGLYYHGRAVSEQEEKEDHLKVEDLPQAPEPKEATEPVQG
jgi:hypothetical protein